MHSSPRIVYLATCFPNPVDTFIRREMQGLRGRGVRLEAICSLRPGAGVLEPGDPPLLQTRSGAREVLRFLWWSLRHPVRLASTLRLAFQLDRSELLVLKQGHSSFIKSVLLLPSLVDLHLRLDPGIHLVHAHFAGVATTVAALLAHLRGIPFTFTAHGSDLFVYAPANLALRLRIAAACVTVSAFNQRHLVRTGGGELADKIHVVRCGIATKDYLPLRNPDCARPPRLLTVALLGRVKGLDVFLEALGRHRRSGGPALDYHLVGDGPQRQELEDQVASLGLGEWVTFHGLADVTGVRRQLAQADLFVLPSRSEGFPVSLMEAHAAGLPLLASRITGIPEILEEGRNGLFLEPENPEQQAAQVAELARDDWALLRECKSRACGLDSSAWDLETSLTQLQALFSGVTGRAQSDTG
jgi:glycosyltransferase involved in cell wall biosynthesis